MSPCCSRAWLPSNTIRQTSSYNLEGSELGSLTFGVLPRCSMGSKKPRTVTMMRQKAKGPLHIPIALSTLVLPAGPWRRTQSLPSTS